MQKAQENQWDSSYIRVEQKWKKKIQKKGASYHDAIG
jgi:hypothetical protein